MLPPVAVILNKRFVPQTPDGPFLVGAAHYSLTVAQALKEASALLGFILYRRKDDLPSPTVSHSELFDYAACDLDFAFSNSSNSIRGAMDQALNSLRSRSIVGDSGVTPVLYHQSGVLLPYSSGFTNIITHHGPLVSDVVGCLGDDLARKAFQGGAEKITELRKVQEAGLRVLRTDHHTYAFEFSNVQISSLLERGIPSSRIFYTPPPLSVSALAAERGCVPESIDRFLERIGSAMLLVAAVARVDAFKNLGLIVDAFLELKREHGDVALLIAGDCDDTNEIEVLKARVASYRESCLFIGSLRRNDLLTVFRRINRFGVFVLSSVFETFAFTPLEAMASGLTTVVPDSRRWIGVGEYVPERLRFAPGRDGLVRLLSELLTHRSRLGEALAIENDLRASVTREHFETRLLEVVTAAGRRSLNRRRGPQVKAVIFDLDNCLSPADELGQELLAPVFEAIRLANQGALSDEALERALADCWRYPLDVVARRHGFSQRMLDQAWAVSRKIEINRPMTGYGDLEELEQLSASLFLVTSGFRRLQESKIRALDIAHLFTAVCVDAIDEEPRRGKREIFSQILSEHHFDPKDVLVVGDDPDAEIETANRLGITTVQILRPGVIYGGNATFHIHDLTELTRLVEDRTTLAKRDVE